MYGLVTFIDVRGDISVGVCSLGLTMASLVVVEIWGEVFHLGRLGGDVNGGNGMECQGVVLWSCNFNIC